jgi:hypothetical protein
VVIEFLIIIDQGWNVSGSMMCFNEKIIGTFGIFVKKDTIARLFGH